MRPTEPWGVPKHPYLIIFGRVLLAVGLVVVIGAYGYTFMLRGVDVGDNNACRSAYSDGPAPQPKRDEYQRIIDRAGTVQFNWKTEWSYFPLVGYATLALTGKVTNAALFDRPPAPQSSSRSASQLPAQD